ncbi:MAG: hypothetical protein CYPHOPRED_002132 [Cyphobasidiales sp. Tagirdzhanova-0007]|nr:MAG: hypothetical protein CYPHOPRED_002132 [Cyphobasidiales sp. Tagirdzhanova-0007]
MFADALLEVLDAYFAHSRHHVKGVDYPAVVNVEKGIKAMGRSLSQDEACVRGTAVMGLTRSDMQLLDTFEGDEYERAQVKVQLLSSIRHASDATHTAHHDEAPQNNAATEATVYLWIASTDMLACRLWSYEDFLRDKLHLWVGNRTDKDAYAEVDRRRRMNGKIIHDTKE